VQREALMIGSSFFEKRIKKSKAKLIYDFDDAIWKLDTSDANKKFEWLKNPNKTKEIISVADLIIAGNNYLMNYALQYNSEVKLIPTTIDTTFHKPEIKNKQSDVITIGWSGSKTTIKHFESAIPVLIKIKEKYGERVDFKVMGDASFSHKDLQINGIEWTHETEVSIINSFDIGIMPLPEDDWAKGKCGLKGLSYMSCAIPTIMSPVGVNAEIIQHGENGFLAEKEEEWLKYLSLLIENPELRKKLGEAARKSVEHKYSVEANKHLYLQAIQQVLK
jgi:glycosyltransferase involved in cell wall biosynthesis